MSLGLFLACIVISTLLISLGTMTHLRILFLLGSLLLSLAIIAGLAPNWRWPGQRTTRSSSPSTGKQPA